MNQLRFQAFLLTRVMQGNAYGSTQELLQAISAASAIPETEWRACKSAFNAIGDKAPLRNTSDLALTHSDIPAYLAREWDEFNAFSDATKSATKAHEIDEALKGFWLTDADMADTTPRQHQTTGPAPTISLVERIKAAIREDGFDVAQAQDGLWYSADEQDRAAGVNGEYRTEEGAWAELVLARAHILEEAGLNGTGVFADDDSVDAESGADAPRG